MLLLQNKLVEHIFMTQKYFRCTCEHAGIRRCEAPHVMHDLPNVHHAESPVDLSANAYHARFGSSLSSCVSVQTHEKLIFQSKPWQISCNIQAWLHRVA